MQNQLSSSGKQCETCFLDAGFTLFAARGKLVLPFTTGASSSDPALSFKQEHQYLMDNPSATNNQYNICILSCPLKHHALVTYLRVTKVT